MRKFLLLLITILASSQLIAQQNKIEDLKEKLKKAEADERVNILNELCESYKDAQPEQAMKYAQEALSLSRKIAFEKGEAITLKNIGIIYQLQGNNTQALSYSLNALKIYEKLNDNSGIAKTLNNVGIVYQNQQNYMEARNYYDRVLNIDLKTKDKIGEAGTLNNIGDLYYQQDKFLDALNFYNKSLKIRLELNDEAGLAVSYKNIGLVYYTQNNYLEALDYYLKSLRIDQRIGNKSGIASTLNNIANTYLKTEEVDTALNYALKSLATAEQIGLDKEIMEASFTLSEIYSIKGNYEKAFEYQELYMLTKDQLFNETNNKKIATLQTSYELEKKEREIDLLNKDNEIKRLVQNALIGGLALVFMLAFVLYRANRQKKKANDLLKFQNAEINQQKEEIMAQRDAIEEQRNQIEIQHDEISKKNENIESSIRYAKRIQDAMLPYEQLIDESIPLHFIYYRPRDVVSGDFYWFYKTEPRPIFAEVTDIDGTHRIIKGYENEKIIIAAIDCTGHGVPGAFMSMIGDSLLNQIVIDKGYVEPDLILNEMHKGIRKALKQEESQNRDGMDMSLCVIDRKEKTISFAGAKNSLIYVQNKKLHEIKADVRSVGGFLDEDEPDRVYNKHCISFKNAPVTFYLYSDGYQDQFGGSQNRKFMKRRFKELLFEIHREPMSYQYELLDKTLLEWKGEESQMDDILVVGVRVE